ncbi:MAG: UDP-N-acetylglucosamine 2-epimerase (non-hydrolyzing) [Deltaproteobacteria bacterium]|nr:UDP-N-acetylglucosamine 2-epimerase (non-hydrolyzing) [Deltaproteobacteria bacterium]
MTRRPVLVVLGTRPEAIKLAPVLAALAGSPHLRPRLCVSGQHREMLDQMLAVFGLTPDHDLAVMQPGQELGGLTARIVTGLAPVLAAERPAALLVQGDTTTAFAAALAAFYAGVPVGHVEAGLRTGRLDQPFPEEMNRRLVTQLARWHYAPTERAAAALRREGVGADRIIVSGNPVVDALQAIAAGAPAPPPELADLGAARLLLVTGHRRESFGPGLAGLCDALAALADRFADLRIVYPVHLNPSVHGPVRARLGAHPRITLTAPLDYLAFVALLRRAHLVITDSGGVQEEAPSFAVPVLVTRAATERQEALDAGVARLVGTDRDAIVAAASALLADPAAHAAMRATANPFGDGQAAARIVDHLAAALNAR